MYKHVWSECALCMPFTCSRHVVGVPISTSVLTLLTLSDSARKRCAYIIVTWRRVWRVSVDFRNRPFRSAWNFYFQNSQNGGTWLKNLSCEDEFHFHENKKTIFVSIASHVPSLRNRDSGQRENGLLKIYGKVKRTFFFHQPRDILQSLALWFPGGSKGQITPFFWRRTSKKNTPT